VVKEASSPDTTKLFMYGSFWWFTQKSRIFRLVRLTKRPATPSSPAYVYSVSDRHKSRHIDLEYRDASTMMCAPPLTVKRGRQEGDEHVSSEERGKVRRYAFEEVC
jgi:hypothetical protein